MDPALWIVMAVAAMAGVDLIASALRDDFAAARPLDWLYAALVVCGIIAVILACLYAVTALITCWI